MTEQEREYWENNHDESAALKYAVDNGQIDPENVGDDVDLSESEPKRKGPKRNAPSAAAQRATKDAKKDALADGKIDDAEGEEMSRQTVSPVNKAITQDAPAKDLGGAIKTAVETSTAPVPVVAPTAAPTVADVAAVSEIPGTPQTGKAPLGHPTRS